MLYFDLEHYLNCHPEIEDSFGPLPEKISDAPKEIVLPEIESFSIYDIEEEKEFEESLEKFLIESDKFTLKYVDSVYLISIDMFPQFRSQEVELKDKLVEIGHFAFDAIHELYEHYCCGDSVEEINEIKFYGININEIESFVRNPALEYLIEDGDTWRRKKISFENVYVESVYAGVYVQRIRDLIKEMMFQFLPELYILYPEQYEVAMEFITTEAWRAYDALNMLDPDEFRKSETLTCLEEDNYNSILYSKAPCVLTNKYGKIIGTSIPNLPLNPDFIPELCKSCVRFILDPWQKQILCSVYRYDHRRKKEPFKCAAYELQVNDKEMGEQ